MSKNKKLPPVEESESDLVKQITEEMLPGPALSPNDPAAALAAIDAWNDDWLAIVESQTPKKYALSKVLEEFIERTNYLARWCETLGLDSSPLVQFAHDARQTYFALQPMLPSVPNGLWLLLDRLKFKLPVPASNRATPNREPIPDDEANVSIRKFLEQHPGATARQVATAVGIALGRVSDLDAWIAEMTRRKTAKKYKPKKTRTLTKKMLESIGKESDAAKIIEMEEAVWQMLLEEAGPDGRGKLHAMRKPEKAEMIRLKMEELQEQVEQQQRQRKNKQQDDDDCS